jgi:hypothetical protein
MCLKFQEILEKYDENWKKKLIFKKFAKLDLLAWTLVLALCFFFCPLLGCFLFMKFDRVSSGNRLDEKHARVVHFSRILH